MDNNQNLIGQIGIYKINFSKNLRRFQEIAFEKATAEPKLADFANKLLSETMLPSTWSLTQLGSSSLLKRRGRSTNTKHGSADEQSPEAFSPEQTDMQSEMTGSATSMYSLNSAALPLLINFNPLMITFCLFLRQIVDLARSNESLGGVGGVAALCLTKRKKIISKLYQV